MIRPTLDDMLELLPAALVAAGVLLAVALSPWRKNAHVLDIAGALAFGGAFAWGFKRLSDWPHFPPLQSTERVFWCVLAAGAVGIAESPFWEKRPWTARFFRVPAVLYLLRQILDRPIQKEWTGVETATYLAAFGAALWLWWVVVKEIAAKRAGLVLIAFSTALGAAGLVWGSYGGAFIGQLGGTLSLAAGLALPFVAFCPRAAIGRGAVAVLTIAAFGLGFNAQVSLIDTPPITVQLLLALLPLLPAIALVPALAEKRPRTAQLTALVLILAVTVGALWIAATAAPPPIEDPYEEYK